MPVQETLAYMRKQKVQFVDLRFTDTKGKEQHITLPSHQVDEIFLKEGKTFDGSSIAGWKGIQDSDMVLLPDLKHIYLDPFYEHPTLILRCDVVEPQTFQGYQRDPRALAKRAEHYLKSTGIADACLIGPEPEFFIFDDVRFSSHISGSFYAIDAKEAAWNRSTSYPEGNLGHRPQIKGGYFPVAPVDSSQDIRSEMSLVLERLGMKVEAHHHEVATAGQNEIATECKGLVDKADDMQLMKYAIHNVAYKHGKTATFMPKPLMQDNGSGMHCHQSLIKNGQNIFAGDGYAGLSETALFYMGGIIKHARALNAITNPSTNSYKRFIEGFEAPVLLAYSAKNRSAAIRIPLCEALKQRRIEVRFPDPMANPYLAFAAQLMAGIDGIQNRIHPGEAMDKNLYDLPPEEMKELPRVAKSLSEALDALDQDRSFLTAGGVFSDDMIDAYIALKRQDIKRLEEVPHPVEFEMYYSL